MVSSTSTRVASVPARPKDSFFIPLCVAAMILAAALSVLYASTQESGSGSDVIDQQRESIAAEG